MFGFKHNQTKKQKWVQLMNGSVVIMLGCELQLEYKYCIPKDAIEFELRTRIHIKEQVVMKEYLKQNQHCTLEKRY